MDTAALEIFLEQQYRRYHRPEFLELDPLRCLLDFHRPADIEIAGLVAALLAYGRAETIIRSVSDIFSRTGSGIADFTKKTSLPEKRAALQNFKHRFNDGTDLALLLHSVKLAVERCGSLEALFLEGHSNNDTTIRRGLEHFADRLRSPALGREPRRGRSVAFLLPSPSGGSACKRLNMYLRWMIRKNDGIDHGVWTTVAPSKLIIPLDTHVMRLARKLGLTARAAADWRAAEEVTARLRRIDPADPVRFDFSLCRNGMVNYRKKAA